MSLVTIVDTGPLVAFLSKNDAHHAWAKAEFSRLSPPLLTCESVVSETCFLLNRAGGDPGLALEFLRRGVIEIGLSLAAEIEPVRRLMTRYREHGMSLADACLVRLSELRENCRVMTVDRDFVTYRRHGRRTIPLLAPFG